MANKHILHINDTWVNVRDQLADTQLAMLTDSDNQLVHRLGSVYYISQVGLDWNGAAFTYHDFICNDLTALQDVIAARYVSHYGDTDTRLGFTTDAINFTAGGINFMDIVEGGADFIRINTNQVNLDLIVHGTTANLLYVDASADRVGILTNGPTVEFTVNGDIQLMQGANRVIDVQARTNSGNGYNLTVQAGDANTSGTGGFLYLMSGDEAGAEQDGEIHIDANPSGGGSVAGDIYVTGLNVYLTLTGNDFQFLKGQDINITIEDEVVDNDGDSFLIKAGDSGPGGGAPSGGGSVTVQAGDDDGGGASGGSVTLKASATGAAKGNVNLQVGTTTHVFVYGEGPGFVFHDGGWTTNSVVPITEIWANKDNANSGSLSVRVGYDAVTAADRYVELQSVDGGSTARYLNLNPDGGNVGIRTTAPSQPLHLVASDREQVLLECSDSGASLGPILELNRNVTGATNDNLGGIVFSGEDDGSNAVDWGQFNLVIADAAAASKDSNFEWWLIGGNASNLAMYLTGVGGLYVDADVSTGDDPVALFDDFNDPVEIQRIVQQSDFDRACELGIYHKKENGRFMKHQQAFDRLLAGGIYQLYAHFRMLQERIAALESA